jgi:phospholipase C
MGNPYYPAQLTPIGATLQESHVRFMDAAAVVLPRLGAGSPSVEALRIFCAHWCLETSHGRAMYCYNFGNMKAGGEWTGGTTYFQGNELLGGGRVVWMDFGPTTDAAYGLLNRFQAYPDFETGITGYFTVKRDNFNDAYQAALSGDLDAFLDALERLHYFTAQSDSYKQGVIGCYNMLTGTSPSGGGIASAPTIAPAGCDPVQGPNPPAPGFRPYPPIGPRPTGCPVCGGSVCHGAYAVHAGWKIGDPTADPVTDGYPCPEAKSPNPTPDPNPTPPPKPDPTPPPTPVPDPNAVGEGKVPGVLLSGSDPATDIKVRISPQQPKPIELVEFADVLFRRHSAVIPPDRPLVGGESDKENTGLGTVAACLKYASENPDAALLVAGHTDYEPDLSYLLYLSKERAKTALALIRGDRDQFAQTCNDSHDIKDYQQILTFIAATRGWPCDPHGIDGQHGPGTARAVIEFQKAYNANGAASPIAADGEVGPSTWAAFFDCYDYALAKELKIDAAALSQIRSKLEFVEPEAVGCANFHPADDGQYVSTSNRRVELLFFRDGEPQMDCHASGCRPELCQIWDRGKFKPQHIPVTPSPLPWTARWDRATVNSGDTAQMLVSAPGAADGTSFVFEVSADGQSLGTVSALASAGAAQGAWSQFDAGDAMRHFSFTASGAGQTLESARDLLLDGNAPNPQPDPPPPPPPDRTGPFLWLKDIDGNNVDLGTLGAYGPCDQYDPIQQLLFDADDANIQLSDINAVAGTQRLDIITQGASVGDEKGANGVSDAGHYLVCAADTNGNPDPTKLLVAGQFGVGQPSVLRSIPAGDTTITVHKWNEPKKEGKGFRKLKHFFVLMLENRSYDHMLGHHPNLTEADGTLNPDGSPRQDCVGDEVDANPDQTVRLTGGTILAGTDAMDPMLVDPGHEFSHVHWGVVGWILDPNAAGWSSNDLSAITMRGFPAVYLNRLLNRRKDQGQWDQDAVDSHAYYRLGSRFIPEGAPVDKIAEALAGRSPSDVARAVMMGFTPSRVPVINKLAKNYAVCDRWFSSLPGPTWPNRLFVHCAQSGGLDDSPNAIKSAWLGMMGHFDLPSIYDRLEDKNILWKVYSQTGNPQVNAVFAPLEPVFVPGLPDPSGPGLKQFNSNVITGGDVLRKLRENINSMMYQNTTSYNFIEPTYGDLGINDSLQFDLTAAFKGGTSQHPINGVAGGEALMKEVYEIIRNSFIWNESCLIITYDEHGGFYDHVAPPPAVAPGETSQYNSTGNSRTGPLADPFRFENYGVRVPTVIISPLIPAGVVDHTIYDHASIIRTVGKLFDLDPLTQRDTFANDFSHLFTLEEPRKDMPDSLDGLPGG